MNTMFEDKGLHLRSQVDDQFYYCIRSVAIFSRYLGEER